MERTNVIIPLLRGAQDYPAWKHAVKMVCMSKDVWRYVERRFPPFENEDAEEKRRVNDQKALTILQTYLAPNLIQIVRNCHTAHETMHAIDQHCFAASLSSRVHLRRTLYTIDQSTTPMPLLDLTMLIQSTNDQLLHVDFGLQEQDLVIVLMAALDPKFDQLVLLLEQEPLQNLTWQYVTSRLYSEEQRLLRAEDKAQSLVAHVLPHSPKKKPNAFKKCSYCEKKGHSEDYCWKKRDDKKRAENEKPKSSKPSSRKTTYKVAQANLAECSDNDSFESATEDETF